MPSYLLETGTPPPYLLENGARFELERGSKSFADTFTQADGPLSANWVTVGTQTQPNQPEVVSGEVIGGSTATAGVRWVNPTDTDDQVSSLTYRGGLQVGPIVAVPGFSAGTPGVNAGTWYFFRVASTGSLYISQKDLGAGSVTNISSIIVQTIAAGDVMRLEYQGYMLRAYINGVQVSTAQPADPIQGQRYLGWGLNSPSWDGIALLDNWSGGDLF